MTLQAKLAQFGRYGAVGLISNAICYGVFLLLIWGGLSPVLSSGAVFCLGVVLSYVGNRAFTFKTSTTHRKDMPRFLAAYGIGLFFSMGCIYVLTFWIHPAIGQLITTVLAAVVIYTSLLVLKFGENSI